MTNRQLEILDFIKRFIASKGYSPTVREIAQGLNLKSPSTVQDHLKKLILNGIITIDQKKSRTIELLVQNEYLNDSNTIVSLPVLTREIDTVTKEFMEIPVYMLNEYDPKNLFIYKTTNSIYIINSSLNRTGRPSVVVDDDRFLFEENPSKGVFGNVISEFKIY